jgi:hypothetical protein
MSPDRVAHTKQVADAVMNSIDGDTPLDIALRALVSVLVASAKAAGVPRREILSAVKTGWASDVGI